MSSTSTPRRRARPRQAEQRDPGSTRRPPRDSKTRAEAAAYDAGYKGRKLPADMSGDGDLEAAHRAGRDERRRERTSSTTKAVRGKARQYGKSANRRRAQLRAKARPVAKAARQVNPTAAAQITTASQAIVLSLVIVAFYVVLQNAAPLAGFLGGAGKAVRWLARSDTSIPYRKN